MGLPPDTVFGRRRTHSQTYRMAGFGGIPQHMLDSMPPDMLAGLKAQMSGKRGTPEGFEDKTSPPSTGTDYARLVSAPFSFATHRGEFPAYARVGGLRSARGQAMNGKRCWVHGALGGVGDRLRVVYLEDAAEPGAFEAAKAAPTAKIANVKPENLRLQRHVVAADPPPGRTLLSALAGDDVDAAAPPRPGFFVFYPGLRRGAADVRGHPCVNVDVAALGNWGSAISAAASEAEMATRLATIKAQRGLAPDAWDPLNGPGWPGIYLDGRKKGLADADARDVVACASWVEAWALWAEIEASVRAIPNALAPGSIRAVCDGGADVQIGLGGASSQPYLVPLRARLPPGTTAAAFDAACEWLLRTSALGRGQATNDIGTGFLGAHVLDGDDGGRTGVALFAVQGMYAPEDMVNNWARKGHFAATIDGTRFNFATGRAAYAADDAVAAPIERPVRREWSRLSASPCGRFTNAEWWYNGSNYDFGDTDLEFESEV